MADGSSIDTDALYRNSQGVLPSENGAPLSAPVAAISLKRTLLFVGIAAASAGLAFAVVRATLARPPADPTTERIQSLIDEANRLLKQLDEQKPE